MAAATKSTTYGNMPHRNGTYLGNYAGGGQMDVTPDLHLKMSKKIAQLTKVVYALNTKNDEHDSIVECLKEQHELELQQSLAETKCRVSELQRKVENSEKQTGKIEHLEGILLQEREKRKQVVEEFERFKITAKEREEIVLAENEQKASMIVKQLLDTKNNFEKQLISFEKTREILEKDKDEAIRDLIKNHHEELDQLMKAHRVRYDEVLKEKEKLRKELEGKIKELSSFPESSRLEREKLEREYVAKLEKIKLLYEKELSVAKEGVIKAESSLKGSQQREVDLRNSWKNQEKQYKDRISILRKELDSSKELVLTLENSLSETKNEASLKSGDNADMKQRLDVAFKDINDLKKQLRLARSEIEVSKKRCEGMADELSIKSNSLHKLEATCMNQEQSINELKKQVDAWRDKSNKLESDFQMVENNKETLIADTNDQMQTLKQNIENLEKEKQDIKFKYLQELVYTKEEAVKKEKTLKAFQEEQLSNLAKKHQQSLEELQTSLIKQKEELERVATEEREKRVMEKDEIIKVREDEYAQLKRLYEQSCSEIERLSSLVQESEVGLGSASTRITRLNDMIRQKQGDIGTLQSDLAVSRNLVETLQKNIGDLQRSQDKLAQEAKLRLEQSLDDQKRELESEWSERLKSESVTLRALLNKQHEDGQHVALEQLSTLKEKEKEEIRHEAAKETAMLQSKIIQLEKDLKDVSSRFTVSERSFKESANQERRRLEQDLAKQAYEYNEKLKELEKKHDDEIAHLTEAKELQMKDLEARLKTAHDEDMLSQLKASQLSIEVVKSQAEQQRKEALTEQRLKFEKERHILENELLRRRKDEIDRVKKDFEVQLDVLKLQVQKADELRSKEIESHASQVEDLSNTIHQNQLQINELTREISESKVNVSQLQREIETKGQEILNVRREANNHIRKSEERLAKVHQDEMDSMVAEHLRETQNMVHEFSRAQELLKDKASALQIMLEEAEGRYRNREPREEDLEQIQSLKLALSERENELKKLLDEKRYYQLELLNRETNFNKVFKATPNIGVIDPLQHKKKSSREHVRGQNGGAMLSSSRLEPIPVASMSVHERKLNQNNPLPPAPPKKLGESKRTTVY